LARLLFFLPILAALLLVACSNDDKTEPALTVVAIETPGAAGSGETPAPEPTPAPGLALTPRAGTKSDLDTARRLEAEGDLRAAADAYVAVAAQGGSDRGEATLGAARLLLELEQPADVRVLLEPFVAAASGRDLAARYLLARAYAALELWQESLTQYDAYIASGRPALSYAYYDRGNVLLALDQPLAAVDSYKQGLAIGVAGATRRTFLLAIAQGYERAGATAQAIAAYRDLIAGSDLPGDDALALSRIAAIKRDQADPTYRQELDELLASHPSTSQALADLNAALDRGESFNPTVRGLVFYRNFDYARAEAAFREQITAAPDAPASAEAYYYLAAIQESRGETDAAREGYARANAVNPAGGIADDALWWQARILEDAGSESDALALYDRIVAEYPGSSWAPDAAFRRGMLPYRAGRYAEAASIWAAGAASLGERERLLLWQGKALLQAGDDAGARGILEPLTVANEDDYPGVRARLLLAGEHEQVKATTEGHIDLDPDYDWQAAENWLTRQTGRSLASPAAWPVDARWLRAEELWLVGRSSQGDAESFALIESYAGDAIAMYSLSRTLQREGRVGMSARAGQRLLRVLNTNPNAGLPKALLSLSYPPAFGALAQRHAKDEKISPLLLLAFVRQESFFDPRAVSGAGALGLTQVLPATGKSLAGRLGVNAFEEELLLQADANLRFGARYMAEQLRSFDGEIFVAFAAYNAGPNAAERWRRADDADDADVFLETIEYDETRLYVQLVAENYAIYRYLYAGEDEPNLPD